MNDKKELEILEQLHNFTLEEIDSNTIPEYPLLYPEYVKNIAKSITEIVYSSYERNTLTAKKSRDTILELLHKWTDSNTHLPLTDSTVDIFIKCLNAKLNTKDEHLRIYNELFLDSNQESPRTDVWNSICTLINKKYTTNLEEKLKSNLVQIWDSAQLRKNDFEFTFLVKNIQNIETENSIAYLRGLKQQTNAELDDKTDEPMEVIEIKDELDEEDTRIELGYALLNENCTVERNKLLVSIIEQISGVKSEKSIQFIDYLWKKRDNLKLPRHVYMKTFIYFPHVYERQIINLSTHVLASISSISEDIEQYETAINTFSIKQLLHVCEPELKLVNNVMSVFDSLLKLSLFDTRMLVLINIVRSHYLFVNKE